MNRVFKFIFCAGLAAAAALSAQQPDIIGKITGGERPVIAIPDFRGSGDAQNHMGVFNRTLWDDVDNSGVFRMAAKSMYPLQVPQQPQDFKQPAAPAAPARRGAPPPQPMRQGPWLTDWSGPPVNASYLAFGYTAIQDGRLVLFGYLYDVTQQEISGAQVIGKLYFGSADEAGAQKVAREFASEIISRFGGTSLAGAKIFFVSNRTGDKEIWSMDYDGSNQNQITHYKSLSLFPTVSPDGTKLAFTSYAKGAPGIFVHSLETNRALRFYNQPASMTATPEFTPDGQRILFSSTAGGAGYPQIFAANLDGTGLRRLTYARAIDVEPRVNPKTGSEVVFVSGRSGLPQIYKMSIDGADVVRLTNGEGEAVNPFWHPDGQHIVFAWTRGYEPGNYNIFIMDVATLQTVQLTHGVGRNENPSWAPDGRHIAFTSYRTGSPQIWTMLADGRELRQLTTRGRNEKPVWRK
jgi:TolB protein